MVNDMISISWADAPDDPAGQALYRINQLENLFIQHVADNEIRQDFLLSLLRMLVHTQKIDFQDIHNAVELLKSNNQQHLRADGDGTTMQQDAINWLLSDLKLHGLAQ